ncbi:S-layer homology domain-containing protein [Limnothrix redekei LRLZ20PSL1]|uniref:S-layer homology domain-containing protein n=1 Tax=Limnothrix redekei LRLZ20PSL1 TaxID=3112953 RepID=A0ABW7CAK7_9CYAN
MADLQPSSHPVPSDLDSVGAVGVPPQFLGLVLQRGGDEVLLEKVPDRFVVRPKAAQPIDPTRLPDVTQVRPLGRGMALVELLVAPARLDPVMDEARRSGAFDYVSHVYQYQGQGATRVYLGDEVTIVFHPTLVAQAVDAIAQGLGLVLVKPLDGIPNAFIYRLSDRTPLNPLKIANTLLENPAVLSAEPNAIIESQPFYRPRDGFYSSQWYLQNNGGSSITAGSHIDAEKAWDITRGDRSIIVAIADDGIDLSHPDFQGTGKIVSPKDFKDNDFNPLPGTRDDSHGTACAGVAVAEENGSGIVGVAPRCALMPIRTTGYLDDQAVEELFDWCVSRGAAVVSCSWGPGSIYFPLSTRQRAALNRAATQGRNGKGCVIVFAAGNANRPVNGTVNEQGWPNNVLSGSTEWLSGFAAHPDVIAVSAATSLNRKAAYSNWGDNISVCAPSNNAPPGIWLPETGAILTPPQVTSNLAGAGVFTTDRLGAAGYSSTDFTADFGGTSSACPVVAGVAALVLSANPNLTAREVKQILESTADKIVDTNADPQFGFRYGSYDSRGFSRWFGYGKVNAYKAVLEARRRAGGGSPAPSPGPTPSPGPLGDDVTGHWAEAFIRQLIQRQIMSGYKEDGTFRPNTNLTRGQFAALLVKAFPSLPNLRSGAKFWDVPASFWAAGAIDQCYRRGLLAGFPDGSFKPNANLTRAQALVALVNGLGLTGGTLSVLSYYSDAIRIPNFARDAIATATVRRMVVNYPDLTRLEAERAITRGEVSAFLYQALVTKGLASALRSPYIVDLGSNNTNSDPASSAFSDITDHWAAPFINTLAAQAILSGYEDGSFHPDEPINRAQLAAVLVKAFDPGDRRSGKVFQDVPSGYWAAAAIDRAYRGQFLSGMDADRFGPELGVPRWQLAAALAGGLAWPDESPEGLAALDDRAEIPSAVQGKIAAALKRQILQGQPSPDRLNPNQPTTRADLASFIHQALIAEGRLS